MALAVGADLHSASTRIWHCHGHTESGRSIDEYKEDSTELRRTKVVERQKNTAKGTAKISARI